MVNGDLCFKKDGAFESLSGVINESIKNSVILWVYLKDKGYIETKVTMGVWRNFVRGYGKNADLLVQNNVFVNF